MQMSDPEHAPPRPAGMFETLVTAAEGYPAMERLAAEASSHIWMAFRIFDPTTRLRAETGFGETWQDLLRCKLEQGVSVRLLLSDFDPIAAPDLHEGTWRAVYGLDRLSQHGDLQILPVRHEARVGRGLRLGLWLPAALKLEADRRALNALPEDERKDAFFHRPGLWRYLAVGSSGRLRWRAALLPRLFPGTLHHKILVADGSGAVIGGLDVDERRFDDPRHRRPADQTWHDVSVTVDGPIVADIADHISSTWNANRLRMAALRREQTRRAPTRAPAMPAAADPLTPPDAPPVEASDPSIRLIRTVSTMRRRAFFSLAPRTVTREIIDAHLQLIEWARTALYFETQFFRCRAIAEALATAGQRNRDLSLVMILPGAPEDVAFEEKSGLAQRFGEQLQSDCVDVVQNAFGDRAGIFSPARHVASDQDGRAQLRGAEIIYVHSKIAIADEDLAIVSSANLNGRSLFWDTEAGVVARGGMVRGLRDRLLRHWAPDLAEAEFATNRYTDALQSRALRDAGLPPDERSGLLVPYARDPAEKFGVSVPGVPEEMV